MPPMDVDALLAVVIINSSKPHSRSKGRSSKHSKPATQDDSQGYVPGQLIGLVGGGSPDQVGSQDPDDLSGFTPPYPEPRAAASMPFDVSSLPHGLDQLKGLLAQLGQPGNS